ncbi:glutamate receptor 2 [Caerostris extrusa]|uniref:Glutamate receptor 2 n=1 Tax=Caerostris extrusa TaxID=172846 RepID=A0AAV4XK70_CAEEX|nr:glutamate receptor 2 [Caerostris extrusa]
MLVSYRTVAVVDHTMFELQGKAFWLSGKDVVNDVLPRVVGLFAASPKLQPCFSLYLTFLAFWIHLGLGFASTFCKTYHRMETDMVLADLTKTPERAEVISFSTPFMTLGLNLLVSKPQDQPEEVSFGPFAFLTVWSLELWLAVALAVVVFGAACYGASRWTGAPDRVRALESKGTDSLSPCGSLWFTVGALLQRDTGIYPRSITHRVWALLWWSFCFFLLVSYVSALTAALLQTRSRVTTTYAHKTSQEVLEDLLHRGSPVIGTTKSGSSLQFFQNSNVGQYRDFGRYLTENPDALSDTSTQAFQRVRSSKGGYAFVMESSKSEYYTNRPPCDTLATPGYFTTRVFAPALQKNSTLNCIRTTCFTNRKVWFVALWSEKVWFGEVIDHGILSLIESGTLRELYEKWWHNFVDQCEDPNMNILPKVYNQSMTLHEVSGVFYLLMAFALLSVCAAFIEHYVSNNRLSIK